MATTTYTLSTSNVGSPIPALPHAISVSLPTWQDVVDYEEGRLGEVMETGYPRFFIHRSIQKLAHICERKFGTKDELAILFPTLRIAEACRTFIHAQTPPAQPRPAIRLTHLSLSPVSASPTSPSEPDTTELHIVFLPPAAWPLAKAFWQHTGLGISSRMAERCLALWEETQAGEGSPTEERHGSFIGNRRGLRSRYGRKPTSISSPVSPTSPTRSSPPTPSAESIGPDQSLYVEERYGRNLPLAQAELAKLALRRRIAGTLLAAGEGEGAGREVEGRGVEGVSEDDVWLFPTGMASIWHAHQLALATRPPAKSVCFGFPYTDTLKILQKWGPGCHFFGHGTDADLDSLSALLASGERILCLFCEFPSNPLLRSADLKRLRALGDQYDFIVVIDETLGNFSNVEVLPYADVLVSSLTKVFSGETNVMGGSLVLNPKSRHYPTLKSALALPTMYEDTYWPEDAIFMERNSRSFLPRVHTINTNARAVCTLLHAAIPRSVVARVMYPLFETREHYDACRLPHGGYGGLFSVIFTSEEAGKAFFDALPCEKGPSLGTSFTLACPYTVIAHYGEQEWANGYGVDSSLVRVSVGMEEEGTLLEGFARALRAAEEAVGVQSAPA